MLFGTLALAPAELEEPSPTPPRTRHREQEGWHAGFGLGGVGCGRFWCD